MATLKLNLTEEEVNKLKASGSHIETHELIKSDYSLRDVSRIADLAPAWVRTQLKTGKIAGFKKKVGQREVWAVKAAEVHRIRVEQAEKLLERLERPEGVKKYVYRRPTEWAYHLTVKAIKKDTKLDANQKKVFLAAMKRYETMWERKYQERLAKKEANKANNDSK